MSRFISAQQVPVATDFLFKNDKQVFKAVANGVLRPPVLVRIGRRLFFDHDRLSEFIEAGGAGLSGGWKHDPGTDSNADTETEAAADDAR